LPGASTTFRRVLAGKADASIRFGDFVQLIRTLGFEERIRGDHHIFTMQTIPEIINVQPLGRMAKRYQVRQVRLLILKYGLGGDLAD
jgi:hypothetical protein